MTNSQGELIKMARNTKYEELQSQLFVLGDKTHPILKKVVIDKNTFDTLCRNLSQQYAEDMKKSEEIIKDKDRIIQDAEDRAGEIIRRAEEIAKEKTNRHAIVRDAQDKVEALFNRADEKAQQKLDDADRRAQEMLDNATAEAEHIKNEAEISADEIKAHMFELIDNSIENIELYLQGAKQIKNQAERY
jgi:vacuolar-type H+-ATPase subunit H